MPARRERLLRRHKNKTLPTPLPLLGLGTAAVIAAQDEAAASYYRQALEKDPGNKTAKRNLNVLEGE